MVIKLILAWKYSLLLKKNWIPGRILSWESLRDFSKKISLERLL